MAYKQIKYLHLRKGSPSWYLACKEHNDWDDLPVHLRMKIYRCILQKPDACPGCGSPAVRMWNASGDYRDNESDYIFLCPSCNHTRLHPPRDYTRPGDKVKPWSSLTRQSKMFRVRRDLPKPIACQYCDSTTVQLVSKSGRWLEDLVDYVWCCRYHGRVFAQLASYQTAKTPYWQARNRQYMLELLQDLFPHWTNSNSMGGSFAGHSILNKTSAGGRFYTISDTFLKEWLG